MLSTLGMLGSFGTRSLMGSIAIPLVAVALLALAGLGYYMLSAFEDRGALRVVAERQQKVNEHNAKVAALEAADLKENYEAVLASNKRHEATVQEAKAHAADAHARLKRARERLGVMADSMIEQAEGTTCRLDCTLPSLSFGLTGCAGGTTTITEIQAKRLVCPVEPIVKDCPDFRHPQGRVREAANSGARSDRGCPRAFTCRVPDPESDECGTAEHARCVKRIEERD